MPWRLILFLLAMALFVVFIGFNLENKADISFGFAQIKEIPIFISLFFSFALGVLFMVPFIFTEKKKTKKKFMQTEQLPALQDNVIQKEEETPGEEK